MNNEQTKQIYVLLSNPNTVVAKMIGFYTRAPYNHASIAFDSELREMYSFGRKHPMLPILGGFVKENIHSRVFDKASCAIYSCTVSESVYHQMRDYVRQFEENKDLYSYNFLGILGVVLNMELGGKNSFFCSQFVSSVFLNSGMQLLDKSACLTTPDDLSTCSCLKLHFRGSLNHYRDKYCHSKAGYALQERTLFPAKAN